MYNRYMNFVYLILLMSFLGLQGFAQDERFIRKELVNNAKKTKFFEKEGKFKWNLPSKFYQLDLNSDGFVENIQFQKRDGTDYICIYQDDFNKVFEAPLKTWIGGGRPYKLRLVNLSKEVRALIIFYYEGHMDFARLKSTSRLYVLTIDKGNLKEMFLHRGPAIIDEQKTLSEHYHLRKYQVKVIDFNGDGQKGIGIFYGNLSRVMEYLGGGRWSVF
jgi:hypothetical protein